MWDLTIHFLGGQCHLLAHYLVSSSDIICKTQLLRKGFHTLIRNVSFYSSTDVGPHNKYHIYVADFSIEKFVIARVFPL